jgi:hypothetical protein
MSNRFPISMLMAAAIAVFIIVPTVVVAQGAGPNSPAERAKWVRDFNGVWSPAAAQQDITSNLLPGEEISLTPFGAEQYNKIDEADSPAYRCEPYGPTRIMSSALPYQIFQTPDAIGIVFEHIDYRVFYMNGKHPDDILDYPDWEGHSVGRWEGDTLVVDTVGMNDKTWLDAFGLQHSGKLHIVERFRKTGPDSFIWQATADDPLYFTKPFTWAFNVTRVEYRIMPDRCEDTPPDDFGAKKVHGVIGARHRVTPTYPPSVEKHLVGEKRAGNATR